MQNCTMSIFTRERYQLTITVVACCVCPAVSCPIVDDLVVIETTKLSDRRVGRREDLPTCNTGIKAIIATAK